MLRVAWWLPVKEWVSVSEELVGLGVVANVHCDQRRLMMDPGTSRFSAEYANFDVLFIDRELFPVLPGYVSYDSSSKRYRIDFYGAVRDLLSACRRSRALIVSTGGMFAWYVATPKGCIPSSVDEVDVVFPWGTETVRKCSSWDRSVLEVQDLWDIGNRGWRTLYYIYAGRDPGKGLQAVTDGLYAELPFTGTVVEVNRAIKVDGFDVSVTDIGFTPVGVVEWSGKTVSVSAMGLIGPLMVYGTSFGSARDSLRVVIDAIYGFTRMGCLAMYRRSEVRVL